MGRRTRGPGAHHDERREQIADAVLEIVAERGLSAVSLNQVATQAGVSPGRVQHYFPTKKELITAAFDRGNEQSRGRIRDKIGQDLETASPRQVLTVVLTELIPYDTTTNAHLRVRQSFTALALSDEAIAARLRKEYAQLHQQIADLVDRARATADTPDTDTADTAVALVALAEGLAYYVLIDVCALDTARNRLLTAIAQI